MAPEFITNLIQRYVPTRSLRSASACRLVVKRTLTKTYGDRSYVSAAANLWNDLPITIRQAPSLSVFKSHLKTHLFKQWLI